jgi:hypothetical protein
MEGHKYFMAGSGWPPPPSQKADGDARDIFKFIDWGNDSTRF